MRLRTRYLVSLLALVAVLTVPVLYGMYRVRDLRGIALDLRHQAASTAVAAGRLSRFVAELDRHLRAYVATTDPDLELPVAEALRGMRTQVEVLGAYEFGNLVSEEELPLAGLTDLADSVRTLVRGGSYDEATRHLNVVGRPLIGQADQAVLRLSGAMDQKATARLAEAERIAAATIRATTIAVIIGVLAALLLGVLAAALLTRSLDRLRKSMAAVAEGRLDTRPDPASYRADEVGDLFRSFHAMTTRLSQLDRMKAEFVAIASHDLKTPINVIAGYAELIEEAGWTPDQRHREVVAAMRDQTRALADRLDQLIEISRMEARGLRLGLEEINIRHFASGIETKFAPEAVRYGVDLAVSVARGTPTFLVADPDCLRMEIMGNLLTHAMKFSPRHTTVQVHFEGAGGLVRIHITDHGPAVKPELAEHLFDPYFRGSVSTGRVGSGAGLPLAHAGVKAHGGAIMVESDERGTRFTVELPLHPARTQAIAGGVG